MFSPFLTKMHCKQIWKLQTNLTTPKSSNTYGALRSHSAARRERGNHSLLAKKKNKKKEIQKKKFYVLVFSRVRTEDWPSSLFLLLNNAWQKSSVACGSLGSWMSNIHVQCPGSSFVRFNVLSQVLCVSKTWLFFSFSKQRTAYIEHHSFHSIFTSVSKLLSR